MAALFEPTSRGFLPHALTGGPWRADAQHGGPPSALLGRELERIVADGEFIARVSVELVRPVPVTELTTVSSRTEVSRRVAHGHAELRSGDVVVAHATALLLRKSDGHPTPTWRPHEPRSVPEPDRAIAAPPWTAGDDVTSYHRDAVEFRFVEGEFGQPGPALTWVRLRQPLVEGEETSALCRVLAVVDFGSGVSAVYDPTTGVGMINADVTLALHRSLEGEWVGLDATTRVGGDGIGLCTTNVFDPTGQLGAASQSLLGLVMQNS